jgi:hypothetical protein
MSHESQPYRELFPVGTSVRVVPRSELERFVAEWKWHHPLEARQLEFGGALAVVESVGFYHGGDVLYELRGMPGTWHEKCLLPA